MRSPATDPIPIGSDVSSEDGHAQTGVFCRYANECDESVPATDAAVEAVVVEGLAVAGECL